MKKCFLFLCVAVMGLFTSCNQEDVTMGGDQLVTIRISAPQLGLSTRSGSTAFADPSLESMRVALIISTEDGNVVTVTTKDHSFGDGSTACSFEARLYKGKTYNISAWADFGANYYTIPTQPGVNDQIAPVVKMKSASITGSNNKYDAYFGNQTTTLTDNGDINIKLARPFALVKVNTTDWDADAVKLAGYRPNKYATVFNAPTQLNLVSGVADEAQDITVSAAIVDYDADAATKELHYDYLFANATSSILPAFTVVYKQGETENSDYIFENIPVQRNYQTNITGNILTKNGKISVTIDPLWNDPANEITIKEVATPSAANEDLTTNKDDTKGKEYVIKTTPENDNTIIIPDGTKAATLSYTLEDLGTNNQITVKDENPGTQNNYGNEVTLKIPDNANPTVYVNTQSAHVTVIGDANVVYANTSENTFVVAEGSTIAKIIAEKGNIDIYGTVTAIERSTNNPDEVTYVNIYEGGVWTNWTSERNEQIKPIINCGTYAFDPTGYNVEGSTVIANETSPATWTVAICDEWQYFVAKEFSNVSGSTITIMNAAELALFAKNVNADVNYTGYTIKLGTYINLSAHQWNPIMLDEDCATNLTFDGCGYSISGLKMTREENYSALFGSYFSHGTIIKNLVINNPDIKQTLNSDPQKALDEVGLNYTAALVAHMGCGDIDNCSIIGGTISGVEQVGALVGYVACGDVTNCYVKGATISGDNRVGGIAGKANTDSEYKINNNKLENVTLSAKKQKGGVVGQIMGGCNNYEIKNNSIDVPGVNCPIGTLRSGQKTAFTSALEANITGNSWTTATLDAESYTYTNAETNAGDQIIWNGEPKLWIAYAAKAYSSETSNAITITTPEQLALLAKKINSGTSYNGYTITIDGTFDMSAHWWVPINAYGKFSGATIQGTNNASINNLKIDKATYEGNYQYYAGFIAQSTGQLIIKDLKFEGAISVSNGSGIAVVLGLSYGNTTFENVSVKNSQITAATKAGALLGFSGGDGYTIKMKNCAIDNVTVTASYSYALFAGLINTNDHIEFEGCTSTNSNAIFDENLGAYAEYIEINAQGKMYTYGVSGSNLWITGVNNAWAEIRTNPNPTTTIGDTQYTVKGDKVFLDNGSTPITIVE